MGTKALANDSGSGMIRRFFQSKRSSVLIEGDSPGAGARLAAGVAVAPIDGATAGYLAGRRESQGMPQEARATSRLEPRRKPERLDGEGTVLTSVAEVGDPGELKTLRQSPRRPLVEVRSEPLRIAMIGQRGIPATFGGVEHHVEELGAALAARGHRVTVFSRNNYVDDRLVEYRGMRLRHLPTVGTKHLDAIVHSALSTAVACGQSYDIVHYHAVGPGIPAVIPRFLSGAKVVLTVHGLDGDRAKWGFAARTILKTGEWLSAHVPDATIAVSDSISEHYKSRYGRVAAHIPNGVEEPLPISSTDALEKFGLDRGGYVLFVGRIVPEKAPDMLIRAWRRLKGDMRLVIGGESSYTNDFVRLVRDLGLSDDRVVFTGYVYGDELSQLYANAAAFVLPSSLEGLPLTLLEAASHGTPVIASDIAPHLEVIGSDGPGHHLFPCGDEQALAACIRRTLMDPAAEQAGAQSFRSHVLHTYTWGGAMEATESLYLQCLGRSAVAEADRSETARIA